MKKSEALKAAINCLKGKSMVVTAKEVADKMGADESNLSRHLKGTPEPSDRFMKRFNEAFDKMFNEQWLLHGDGVMLSTTSVGRPYYNVDFLGGFNVMVNDQTTLPAYFIDFEPYNKDGICWCNITGHSMEPKIEHGDIIALKEVKDNRAIEFGNIYAIVTNYDLRTVKIVRRGDDDEHLRLVPINKDFDEMIIELSSILRIYKVVCNIKKL